MPAFDDNVIAMYYGSVSTASEMLAAAPAAMRQMLTRLEEDLAPLTGSWEGEARLEYDRIKAAWMADCDRLHQIATSFSPTLDEAHLRTRRMDYEITTDWSTVG